MILCGTDLSPASEQAIKAAGALAKKLSRELLLVTVLERVDAQARASRQVRLEEEAGTLRRELGIAVETLVATGVPEEQLLSLAKNRGAELLVVGAEGNSKRNRRLGSVPEHLCQAAEVPVLVARRAEAFAAWSEDKRPLAMLLGSGLGDASTAALEQVAGWPDLALTVVHVAWPYGEHYRLGVGSPMPLDHLRPEVHHQLVGDLGRWAANIPCSPKLKVVPGWGRIDSHLAQLAREKDAELLVVGSHQRRLGARVWHGSVARNVIHEADCNVLCVPQRLGKPRVGNSPRVVVVPTDFSALADRAVSVAYSLLEPGSSVHLIHVAEEGGAEARESALNQLASRVPAAAAAHGVETHVSLVTGADAWLGIWQYASRQSADIICMSTHSRDVAGSLLLGSQAQKLLQHSRIPVLLVPPDRES